MDRRGQGGEYPAGGITTAVASAKTGRLKNRHSGACHRSRACPRSADILAQIGKSRLGWREPGTHSHNTIILACLYDEATGIMDSGLLASLGPGMTRSYANVPRKRGRPQRDLVYSSA